MISPVHKDIENGLLLEDPPTTVRWEITCEDLVRALGNAVREVAANCYLGGPFRLYRDKLCRIGFHFDNDHLSAFELYWSDEGDLSKSFAEFQQWLEATFGPPTRRSDPDPTKIDLSAGYSHFDWEVGPVLIKHYVLDRFGPEEHVWIDKGHLYRPDQSG